MHIAQIQILWNILYISKGRDRPELPYGTMPGPCPWGILEAAKPGKYNFVFFSFFLIFTFIWKENAVKIPLAQGALRHVNPVLGGDSISVQQRQK